VHLALVTNTLPPEGQGGAERYAARIAAALAADHDITVLTGARTSDIGDANALRLPSHGVPSGRETAPQLAWWLARDQWMPSVHGAVRRQLRRLRPDLVMTFNVQGLSSAVFTALAASNVPHVHVAQDLGLLCLRRTMTKAGSFCGGACRSCGVHQTVWGMPFRRRLRRMIAISEYIRDAHVRGGFLDAERVVTIPHGVDAGPARLRRRDGEFRIGFIGTLAEHKGVATLLSAFRSASDTWRLDVAGTGPLEGAVREEAAADRRITFHGSVEGHAKDEFFDALDVLVVPSECEEGFGLVTVEAAVRGLPSVVADRAGLREAPEAIRFASGDEGALLAALGSYAMDDALLSTVSARLLARRSEFLWTDHVARVESVIATAADRVDAPVPAPALPVAAGLVRGR
jgi:glycosyltransferase involved in cell wall biosynthesis